MPFPTPLPPRVRVSGRQLLQYHGREISIVGKVLQGSSLMSFKLHSSDSKEVVVRWRGGETESPEIPESGDVVDVWGSPRGGNLVLCSSVVKLEGISDLKLYDEAVKLMHETRVGLVWKLKYDVY